MNWQTFTFLPIFFGAFAYSSYRFWILFRLMKAHRGKAPKFSQIPKRIQAVLINVLGQKAVLRKRWVGSMHAIIFWGFLIITVGTLEQLVSTVYAPANFEFIGKGPYRILVFVQDFF